MEKSRDDEQCTPIEPGIGISSYEYTLCPECFSSNTRRAYHQEYRTQLFLLRRPNKCLNCGLFFRVPSSITLCSITGVAALGVAVAALVLDALPAILTIASGTAELMTYCHAVLGTIASIGFTLIALESMKTARYSRRYRRRIRTAHKIQP